MRKVGNTMRVLFITIPFYEYIDKIKEKIADVLTANVDVLCLEQKSSGCGYMVNKLSKGEFNKKNNIKMQKEFFQRHKDIEYDYVFVLVGRGLDKECFYDFIQSQKKAKKILYLWDDVNRIDNFKDIKSAFDSILSFDKRDCTKYGFSFLPLFYCDDYVYKNEEKTFDISSIGFLHTDRANILEKVRKKFPEDRYKWFALLKTTRKHALMMLLSQKSKKLPFYIGFKYMTMAETARVVKQSKVVIDMPHSSQSGLSIRTIEALAARCKMVTTNVAVKEYDFFDDRNICIIDRDNPLITDGFFDRDYVEVEANIIKRYSLDEWVRTIFNYNM